MNHTWSYKYTPVLCDRLLIISESFDETGLFISCKLIYMITFNFNIFLWRHRFFFLIKHLPSYESIGNGIASESVLVDSEDGDYS